MDQEKAIQKLIESQQREAALAAARAEADRQSIEANRLRIERLEAHERSIVSNLDKVTRIMAEIAEGRAEHEQHIRDLRAKAEAQRAENEEFRKSVDERIAVVIKMMDEWIRDRRNGRGV